MSWNLWREARERRADEEARRQLEAGREILARMKVRLRDREHSQDEMAEAVRQAEAVRSDLAMVPDALYGRATVRRLKGDRLGAADDYRRALQLAPESRSRAGEARTILSDLHP